jgi:NTE family protein
MKTTALRRIAATLLLLSAVGAIARAQAPPPPGGPPPRRPKIGLALGGGGARGAAHIGVLKVLEEMRIPIDYIAGTSMGSVVGGLYCVGYSPDRLDQIITKIEWANLFVDTAPRKDIAFRQKQNDYFVPPGVTLGFKHGIALPSGLIAGRKLGFLLNTLTLPAVGVENFEDLSIPIRAVAADARTGQPVQLTHGSLSRAIRASMSIPVVFTPVRIDDHLLIDGGEAENLPVQTVRAMGADYVIAVDVASSSEIPAEAPSSVAEILGRLIDLPLLRNTEESRKLADLVITPDLKGFSSGDFPKAGEIIPKGEIAARADGDKLSRLSVPQDEYDAWRRTHRVVPDEKPPMLDDVVVDPIANFDIQRIERVIATTAGLPFNDHVLQADMRRIAGMDLWENVEFHLEKSGGRNVLHIIATPKSWGPTYLSAGIDFDISQADADFDVSVLLDATELNRLGADWKTGLRLGTELAIASRFFQPLEWEGRFFAGPRADLVQTPIGVFNDDGEAVGEYRVREWNVGLDLGIELGHLLQLGQFSVGIEFGGATGKRLIGDPAFPDVTVDTGALVGDLRLDQLDNLWFPKDGWFVDVSYLESLEGLHAEIPFHRGELLAIGVKTIGRWTGGVRLRYGDTFGSDPLFFGFRLGGLFNLSGRPVGQLRGDTLGFGSLTLRYRLTKTPGAIVKGIYVGASAEVGNVWQTRNEASISDLRHAGSVFLATDTLLGPIYLAYGNSDKKNQAAYLFLNRSF